MKDEEERLSIGELASQLGITTRTIRYYEEIGLMDPNEREPGKNRTYGREDVIRLKFIVRLKDLGITLKEMQELANIYKLSQDTQSMMPVLIEILDEHLGRIDDKIANITALRTDIANYRKRIAARLIGETV